MNPRYKKYGKKFGNHNSMDASAQQKYAPRYGMKPKFDLKLRGEVLLSKKSQDYDFKKPKLSHLDSLD